MKYAVGILIAFFLVGSLAYLYNHRQPQPNPGLPMETITIGSTSIQVEVASNDEQRQQGLSDRASLAAGSGMLFIFDPARKVGFWMKDMRFSIDMIFADEQGTIIKIDDNVSPESYFDRQPPEIFPSGVPVRYVLEVPAGYSQKKGIAIGQKIVVK
jgi:uncharacterized membrane protein (UPF0127 family)